MKLTTTTFVSVDGVMQAMADPGDNPIALALNTRSKYVASTTLIDPRGPRRPSSPVRSRLPSAS